ncbi:hypothetical protein MBANPS3_011987 [Mucor bainieri]
MHAEFDVQFAVGKRFESKEEVKDTVSAFGKKFNVVISTKDSHPSKGQFNFICKHGRAKRDVSKDPSVANIAREIAVEEKKTEEENDGKEEDCETIDLTDQTIKKPYKKSTQKLGCNVAINVYNWTVTTTHREHNHPLLSDVRTYAIHRKQPAEVMRRIQAILAGGHSDPVSTAMTSLEAWNIKNVTKKDIQNIQSTFLKSEDDREVFVLINWLEDQGYIVRIQVKPN